jgi:hypothetical protein
LGGKHQQDREKGECGCTAWNYPVNYMGKGELPASLSSFYSCSHIRERALFQKCYLSAHIWLTYIFRLQLCKPELFKGIKLGLSENNSVFSIFFPPSVPSPMCLYLTVIETWIS